MEFLFYFWSLLLCAAHAAHQSLNNEIYLPQICSQKEIRKEMERKKIGEKENETKRDREDIKRKKERYKILEQDN